MASVTQLADMPEHSSAHTRGLRSSFLHPAIQTVALNAKLERQASRVQAAVLSTAAMHSCPAEL